jgi:uncharacterized protein YqeY
MINMSTKEKLSLDLKDALRANDDVRKRTIRMTLAAIKNAEIDNLAELEEQDVLAIIQKEVKSRHETIDGAAKAGRKDLIDNAQAEIILLEAYLPKALSVEELETIIARSITDLGATSMRDMGAVMQAVMPIVRGRADGKEVNQIVRKMLNS